MLGLYIHIPFCDKKCYYCDFTSYVCSEHLMYDYVTCLLKELELHRYEKFDTVFIGGGTPSYLNHSSMELLLKGINNILKNSKVLELTVECNPGTVDYEKLKLMYFYGVNRLSIGLQSVNYDTLRFMGRNHSFEDFDNTFNDAIKAGFKNISADLIFGVPCEKFADYSNTINTIKNYDLSHISAYNLILEQNTRFYKMYERGMFSELSEEMQLDMYIYTKEKLEHSGFKQYEVSNYAKEGSQCLHNMVYWNFDSYLGIGVSAHSFYKGSRFENIKDVNEYIKMLKSDNHKYINVYENTKNDNIQDYIMLGFRKNKGISTIDFKNRFNIDFFVEFEKEINKYIDNGLMNFEEDNIFLTSRGIILMNRIISDFVFK